MRNQQPQQQRPPFQDVRDELNVLWIAVNGYATGILPFIRKDFGTDFLSASNAAPSRSRRDAPLRRWRIPDDMLQAPHVRLGASRRGAAAGRGAGREKRQDYPQPLCRRFLATALQARSQRQAKNRPNAHWAGDLPDRGSTSSFLTRRASANTSSLVASLCSCSTACSAPSWNSAFGECTTLISNSMRRPGCSVARMKISNANWRVPCRKRNRRSVPVTPKR